MTSTPSTLATPSKASPPRAACSSKVPRPIQRAVWDHIPPYGQKIIKQKRLKVYYLDTVKIAKEIATDPDLQQRMQGVCLVGIFIRVTPFAAKSGMSDDQVLASVEKYIRKYFGKRGEHVVQENLKCVREGLKNVMEIPWDIIMNGEAKTVPKAEAVVFAR
jgi:pyruvate-ferredoxin/flavodoxin oxidoreductase